MYQNLNIIFYFILECLTSILRTFQFELLCLKSKHFYRIYFAKTRVSMWNLHLSPLHKKLITCTFVVFIFFYPLLSIIIVRETWRRKKILGTMFLSHLYLYEVTCSLCITVVRGQYSWFGHFAFLANVEMENAIVQKSSFKIW